MQQPQRWTPLYISQIPWQDHIHMITHNPRVHSGLSLWLFHLACPEIGQMDERVSAEKNRVEIKSGFSLIIVQLAL